MTTGKKKTGPGSPPRDTRFKPGQSGNPNGRPKGSKNIATEIQRQLRKQVTIMVDGKPRRMAVLDVIVRRMITDAMKGSMKPLELLLKLTAATATSDASAEDTSSATAMPDKEALKRIHKRLEKLVGEVGG